MAKKEGALDRYGVILNAAGWINRHDSDDRRRWKMASVILFYLANRGVVPDLYVQRQFRGEVADDFFFVLNKFHGFTRDIGDIYLMLMELVEILTSECKEELKFDILRGAPYLRAST